MNQYAWRFSFGLRWIFTFINKTKISFGFWNVHTYFSFLSYCTLNLAPTFAPCGHTLYYVYSYSLSCTSTPSDQSEQRTHKYWIRGLLQSSETLCTSFIIIILKNSNSRGIFPPAAALITRLRKHARTGAWRSRKLSQEESNSSPAACDSHRSNLARINYTSSVYTGINVSSREEALHHNNK